MVLVAMSPGARSPTSIVTVLPDRLMTPAVVVADTKLTVAGNTSVIFTPVDVALPTAVTFRVYVSVLPTSRVAGVASLVMTNAGTVVSCVIVS